MGAFTQPTVVHSTSEGRRFNADRTLEVVECYSCKMLYAIPQSLLEAAQEWPGDGERGWKLCCPLGHVWFFTGESREAKLKRELKQERDRAARLAAQHDQVKADRDQIEASRRAYKGQASRLRKRAAGGVCPCCNRTFKELARHMQSKHPDFVAGRDQAENR